MLPKKTHNFYVSVGANDADLVEGRETAVDLAKRESADSYRDVYVERDDGRVRMTFRAGTLQTLVSEAGRRRRR